MIAFRHLRKATFAMGESLKSTLTVFAVGIFLFVHTTSTYAEEEASSEDFILEEVIVTATKMGETKLQETPISITAFSSEFLEGMNASKVSDMTAYVPNAQFLPEGHYLRAFIRGVGVENLWVGGEQSVGFYSDGVYMEKGMGANVDLMDIERLEVLRGPQGTLYGRNSTAGAVNIISKAPTDELTTRFGIDVGNYNKKRVDATISGPIVEETVKARLSVSKSKHDAYVDNLVGNDLFDEDYVTVRSQLQIIPTDQLDIRLFADWYRSDAHPYANVILNSTEGLITYFAGPQPPGPWTVKQNEDPSIDYVDTWGVSGIVNYDFGNNMNLRSTTAWRSFEAEYIVDYDGTQEAFTSSGGLEIFDQFSQELTLSANWDRWNWIAGIYYYNTENKYPYQIFTWDIFEPGLKDVFSGTLDTEAWAGFGNVTYDLTDKLIAEVGIRYSYEERTLDLIQSTVAPGVVYSWESIKLNDTWDAVTPKFGLNYKANDDMLLFGTISRGFKSGTFAPFNPPGFDKKLEPEYLWSYEIGAKTEFLEKRLRANLTGFWYDYQDMHVEGFTQGWIVNSNAAEATIKGIELELTAWPLQELSLSGSISYLNAKFDEYITVDPDTGLPVDVSGNRLPNAPEFKVVGTAQYVVSAGEKGFFTLRGDVIWTDEMFFGPFEEDGPVQDAMTAVNGFVRYETQNGQWSFEIYGRNLLDEDTYNNISWLPLDIISTRVNPPRTFGFKVIYNY